MPMTYLALAHLQVMQTISQLSHLRNMLKMKRSTQSLKRLLIA